MVAQSLFDLKSASLTLLVLVLRTHDLPALSEALWKKLGSTPEVFSHEPVLIDLSHVDANARINFSELVVLLKRYKMLPIGVRGGAAEQREAALAAGLSEVAVDGGFGGKLARAEREARMVMIADGRQQDEIIAPENPVGGGTLVIERPLRSGQQVYAKGGDLVVLAAVNFGAELIADGSIHVYAPLRGKAVAGAKGNVDARIFSTCMEPELVSIAGTYRTAENPLPGGVTGKPAQIRLNGGRLIFEALV